MHWHITMAELGFHLYYCAARRWGVEILARQLFTWDTLVLAQNHGSFGGSIIEPRSAAVGHGIPGTNSSCVIGIPQHRTIGNLVVQTTMMSSFA